MALTRRSRGLALLCYVAALACPSFAQKPACSGGDAQLQTAYQRHNWAEAARRVSQIALPTADDNFHAGMAMAHLQRWPEARAAFLAGHTACPTQERFDVELAGVAFQQKRNAEAAAWLKRGLRLNPHNEYALNFAGSVYYLMGNLPAALKYWNGAGKPFVNNTNFDANLRVQRFVLDRAIAFAPQQVLRLSDYETTLARLNALGIFSISNLTLGRRGDGKFDVSFHAMERNGFGPGRVPALISSLSGVPYETVYPAFWNIGRRAMNLDALGRWDSEKRRVWAELSAPAINLPQRRWAASVDFRDENWDVRRWYGHAPVLGSLHLRRAAGAASFSDIPSGKLKWSLGGEISNRRFSHVMTGSALSPKLTASGTEAEFAARVDSTLLRIPERHLTLSAAGASRLARIWAKPARVYEGLSGEGRAIWLPASNDGLWRLEQRMRGGKIFGAPPFDELYELGVDRDNDLWLRGVSATHDGRKGSAPLGTAFALLNSDVSRRLYSNGLISIAAGPLLDVGRMSAPVGGLAPRNWRVSTGAEVRATVLGTTVLFTYGRDVRNGANTFFATTVH